MNKKMLSLILTCALVLTGFSVVGTLKKANAADDAVTYATVKSITDFRNYIDNDYPCSFQDDITTAWTGYTDVYTVDIPSDGTLLVCCLAPEGHVNSEIFTNYALTSQLEEGDGFTSSRGKINAFDIKAGTYYIRGSRWNGSEETITTTMYIGFIPESSEGVTYSDTTTKFDTTNNATYPAITAKDGLAEYINENNAPVCEDTIATAWKGYSDVHSFTVEDSGWLFVYPLANENHVNWQLFSNENLTSMIFSEETMTDVSEDPYSIYLAPGTYYFRGSRWNGSEENFMFTTFMGFMNDSDRFKATVEKTGEHSATVSFSGDSGLVRIEEGQFDAVNIKSDDFWNTSDRANAVEGTSKEITKNGDYVARLETEDGYYAMVPFTVSGLIELATPSPVPSASPTLKPSPTPTVKPTPTIKPTATPDTDEDVEYNIKVAKKKITVKVKKTAKIKYSVTGGYKGKVKFSCNKKKIATVNQKGVVKGKKKGTCKVTLKLDNGKKAVVTVKVKK